MRFEFTLTGTSALLMHFDDVEWADDIDAWRLDPDNAKKAGEKSGDDRRPAWTWVGYCYKDEKNNLAIPGVNLLSNFKKAGSRVPLKGTKTFKEIAVSGIFIEQEYLAFTNGGKQVPFGPLAKLVENETNFRAHVTLAESLGFKLFVKRAKIGAAKHVRVRPRFDRWTASGTLEVLDDRITPDILEKIFQQAGRIGLGDWRPGSPQSPGPFGMFTSKLKKVG